MNIERILETYLNYALQVLQSSVKDLQAGLQPTPARLWAEVAKRTASPTARLFELLCFSRLMRGRLLFFAESIPWFESDWLIRNELRRSAPWFYAEALENYGLARFQVRLSPEQVLERAAGVVVPPTAVAEYKRFAELASRSIEPGREKDMAREVSGHFETVHVALEAMVKDIRRRVSSGNHCHAEL
jgi:hypothetical protein